MNGARTMAAGGVYRPWRRRECRPEFVLLLPQARPVEGATRTTPCIGPSGAAATPTRSSAGREAPPPERGVDGASPPEVAPEEGQGGEGGRAEVHRRQRRRPRTVAP